MQQIEGRLFEMETKTDTLQTELKTAKKTNEKLLNSLRQQDLRQREMESDLNDLQQYSRRWNLRVYRVPEANGETSDDCRMKVCAIFTDLVGIPTTPQDI